MVTVMGSELTIGKHRVRIEDDTVLTEWIGTPEYEEVRAIHTQYEVVLAEHGHLFIVNDMRRSGMPNAQTRKFIAVWGQHRTIAGVVNFGASLPIRVLQAMILRALALLGNRPPIVIENCGNEAEAFAWIKTRRSKLFPSS